MHLTSVGGARLCAPHALRSPSAAAITPAFLAALDGALRRADRLRLGQLPLLALQNAPAGFDPDAEALATGSASRRSALRLWLLPSGALARGICINALRTDAASLADPAGLAQVRLAAALQRLEGRVAALVTCGWIARDAAARLYGLQHRPQWNATARAGGLPFTAIPHPSGRNSLNNPGGPGRQSHEVVRPLLLAQP
jgi:hypothetical protein